jgi:hypothetical protein
MRSRPSLLGLITFVPPACIAAFVGIVVTATAAGGGEPDDHLIVGESVLAAILLAAVLLTAALTRIYVPHAKQNAGLKDHQRKRWVFALEGFGPFSMPVYWWRHVRRR